MMKKRENDSTAVLDRFGRDRRKRTVKTASERVERRSNPQREAADYEHTNRNERSERRSFNPNFTGENRPKFDRPRREYADRGNRDNFSREERAPRYGRYDDDRQPRGERTERNYNSNRRTEGERTERNYNSDRRTDGDRGRKPYGGKRYGDKGQGSRTQTAGRTYKRQGEERPAQNYPKFNPDRQIGEMRLNRFIAQSGICSRREADDFITAGLVSVNGVIVTELGTKIMPTDEVKFNDSRIQGEKKVYLVLNKPKGYVTSLEDPHAGKTVMELVKGACTERIYPVGRLDKNSLGLLLFTNDGDMTKQLTHPSYKKKKIYQVSLDKPLTRADMDRIAEGIVLEDGEIYADEISYVKDNKQEVGIEIHSGRNRIVRRIFEYLGYTVTKLDRVYYAGLTKKNLKRGAWRFLSREEVERLKSGQYE